MKQTSVKISQLAHVTLAQSGRYQTSKPVMVSVVGQFSQEATLFAETF